METKTPSPSRYIALRNAELDKIEESLKKKLAWVNQERESLVRFASITEGVTKSDATQYVSRLNILSSKLEWKRKRAKAGTMKSAVLASLKDQPEGLTAVELLPRINQILGTNYVRSSLSPQLSRLKREGEVILVDGKWILSSRIEKPSGEYSVTGTPEGLSKSHPNAQGRKADDPGGGP